MPTFQVLNTLASTRPLWAWLWSELLQDRLKDVAAELVKDPAAAAGGVLRRVGDAVVWQSPQGQTVLAHLEALGDSQTRIEQAVTGLETTQAAMASTLGAVHTLSMLTLGVTSLTGMLMLWRLNALKKRLDLLSQRIRDIEGHLNAMQRAHLQTAVAFLDQYETHNRAKESHLDKALGEARQAANIYKNLATDEAQGPRRIEVLNYRGRMYLLALLTEVRCCLLADDLVTVQKRIDEEDGTLRSVAGATFAQTVGEAPEEYLRPDFVADGITLDVMAEVYGQARTAGAVTEVEVRNAGELFEHLRGRLTGRRYLPSLPRLSRRSWRESMLHKFRYAVCCIEETNRVRSLRMLVEEAQQAKRSVRELCDQLVAWKEQMGGALQGSEMLAYRLV